MHAPSTFCEIIKCWPTVADFARDIDVPYPTASAMYRRKSIDSDYWAKIIEVAPSRGIDLTWERLAKMAAGEPLTANPADEAAA